VISTLQVSKLRLYLQFHFLSASSSHLYYPNKYDVKYKLWTFSLCGFRRPESYVQIFSAIRILFPQTLTHACTSPEFLVAQTIKFLKVVSDISNKTNAFLLTHKDVYQCICTEHEAPDKSEVYRTIGAQHGTGFKSVMVHRIWKWLPYFLKSQWAHLYDTVRMTDQVSTD